MKAKRLARPDLPLIFLLVMIIFMMIIPLPTLLIDVLIALNMSVAVLMLMVSVYITNPLQFMVIPPILLIATLFRLSLSISTTRLILTEADAGAIIDTFGKFVLSGSVLVGLIIFLIITAVQFIVITKGSERVAEVSARFALDGMPGKQMSIDADLRSEIIDGDTARAKRKELDLEMQLFGSLDGAMKYVKGDAIAGLFITVVNLIGGLTIGVLYNEMSLGEAVEVYSILTIGDGLVAQLPALFLSITAGLVVTRISQDSGVDLGSEISSQLTESSQPLAAASVIVVLMGFIPGFPTLIFFLIGAALGSSAFLMGKNAEADEITSSVTEVDIASSELSSEIPALDCSALDPTSVLELHLAENLKDWSDTHTLARDLGRVRQEFVKQTGIPFLDLQVNYNSGMATNEYVALLNGSEVDRGVVEQNRLTILDNPTYLDILQVPYSDDVDYLTMEKLVWADCKYESVLQANGIKYHDDSQTLCWRMRLWLEKGLRKSVGSHEIRILMDHTSTVYQNLVQDVQQAVNALVLVEVFQQLIEENVPLSNIKSILESVLLTVRKSQYAPDITVNVRDMLGKEIYRSHLLSDATLCLVLIDPVVEQYIRDSITRSSDGETVSMHINVRNKFVESVRSVVSMYSPGGRGGVSIVLLTARDIRRHVWTFVNQADINVPVIAHSELSADTVFYSAGYVFFDVDEFLQRQGI